MISENMKEGLLKQINFEIFSGYLYMEMANYYEKEGLKGFAHWYEMQSKEEWSHAMRIRTFCFDNDIDVTFEALGKPSANYQNFKEPLVAAYEHEKLITASIHKLYNAAVEEKDARSQLMLAWFVEEQMEEEVTAMDNIRNYELFATCGNGLRHMDSKMGKREG